MCKKQQIANVCKVKKNKRWRHLFLKFETFSEFERSSTTFGLPLYGDVLCHK